MIQLNTILQTQDSARGLIVNMSDVLFDTGQFSLKPGAREKLAKISGIVLAYPTLKLEVEGHTDSVGSDELNMRLVRKPRELGSRFSGSTRECVNLPSPPADLARASQWQPMIRQPAGNRIAGWSWSFPAMSSEVRPVRHSTRIRIDKHNRGPASPLK